MEKLNTQINLRNNNTINFYCVDMNQWIIV